MMHQEYSCRYESTKTYSVLGLKYKGDYSMFIVLPKQKFGLKKVLESLDGETLMKHAQNKYERAYCIVWMGVTSLNSKNIFR